MIVLTGSVEDKFMGDLSFEVTLRNEGPLKQKWQCLALALGTHVNKDEGL